MKHQVFNKILKTLFFMSATLLLNSCGEWYYCNVSGFGRTPVEKSYFLEPIDSALANDLEFQEYAGVLKNRLNESGYREVSPQEAALCIRLGYYIGDKELIGSTTYSSGFSMSNGKITANTNANANGSAKTNLYGNSVSTTAQANGKSSTDVKIKQQTNTYNSSSTSNVYSQDVGCYIEAVNTIDLKPVWTVEVKDHIDNSFSNTSFRKIMPWMIASAQSFFGKSGEEEVKITKKDGVEKKGLVWPY